VTQNAVERKTDVLDQAVIEGIEAVLAEAAALYKKHGRTFDRAAWIAKELWANEEELMLVFDADKIPDDLAQLPRAHRAILAESCTTFIERLRAWDAGQAAPRGKEAAAQM